MTTTSQPTRWLSVDEQAAWRAVVTGSRRLLDQLDADLKELGLNHDDFGVLVALSEATDERLRMSDLASTAAESRSRLSHHITRMEKKGWVQREACPEDRRGSWAVLTPAGRALIEEVAPTHVDGVRRWFLDRVQPDELAAIGRAFARVDEALLESDTCRVAAET